MRHQPKYLKPFLLECLKHVDIYLSTVTKQSPMIEWNAHICIYKQPQSSEKGHHKRFRMLCVLQ